MQVLSELPPKRREPLVYEDYEAMASERRLLDELLAQSPEPAGAH